jgi:mRNA-degrading endonuclease toxin of MazEF toxin-antitoxin module
LAVVNRPAAGHIVLVDWGGAMPGEPTRIRPAVVVENARVFPDEYSVTLVVPLSRDERLARSRLAVRIDPTPENGAGATSWALAHHVNSVSLRRVNPTQSRVTNDQLHLIRQRIALALDLPDMPQT